MVKAVKMFANSSSSALSLVCSFVHGDSDSCQVEGTPVQVMDGVVNEEEVHPHNTLILDRSQPELMHHGDTSQLNWQTVTSH